MPNLPTDLVLPSAAVAPAQPLSVRTRGWQSGSVQREAGEYPVLAIGWYGQQSPQPEAFAYLVFDRHAHEVFWVAQSLVERVSPS